MQRCTCQKTLERFRTTYEEWKETKRRLLVIETDIENDIEYLQDCKCIFAILYELEYGIYLENKKINNIRGFRKKLLLDQGELNGRCRE